jgi:tetratricopeptide (TPR) repeat protein
MTGSLTARQAALFVAVITCVAFLNSFWGRFVFDDIHEIERNPSIERLLPPWDAMFVGNKLPARPLPYLTFAIDTCIWGKKPFGYHLTNLAVHVIAALALFHLVRLTLLSPRLRGRWGDRAVPLAMVIAMLWAVHPLQTQAVTYIYQRIESMTGMFCLLSLACFAWAAAAAAQPPSRAWPRSWLAGSVAAAAAAMASKESAVALPLLILAYVWFFVEPPAGESWLAGLRRRWGFYLPLFATWAIIGLQLRMQASQYQEFKRETLMPFAYALTEAGVILHYLRLAVWPVGQCFDYGGWPVAKSVGQVLPALAAILALLGVTIVGTLRRRPWAAFGVLFFLALAPTSSIMPIEAVANEHRMYLALAGVVGVIVCGGVELAEWIAARRPGLVPQDPRVPAAVAALAIMLLVVATQLRNQLYHTLSGVWIDVLSHDPGNHRAHWTLAGMLNDAGETDAALMMAEKVLDRKPSAHVFSVLAEGHTRSGDHATAERLLRRGLELQLEALGPDDKAVLATTGNLAVSLRLQGKRDEAEAIARQSIDAMRRVLGKEAPTTISVELIASEGMSRAGDHAAAEAVGRAAVQTARTALGRAAPVTVNAVVVLATSLRSAGKSAEAEKLLRDTLKDVMQSTRRRPEDVSMLSDQLATLLEGTGRLDEAVAIRRRLANEAAARLGQEHGEARAAATKLALTMAGQATAQGKHAEAVRLYKLILDAYRESLGTDHPDTVVVRAQFEAAREAASAEGR